MTQKPHRESARGQRGIVLTSVQSLPGEEWRFVPGTDAYAVSNMGRIKRIEYLLRPAKHWAGYPFVNLRLNGRAANRQVHCLVAEAFLGPRPSPEHEVAHLDGDPTNAHLSNLRYVTRSENQHHRRLHGTSNHGERNRACQITSMLARVINRVPRSVSSAQLAATLGCSVSIITGIRVGRTWRDTLDKQVPTTSLNDYCEDAAQQHPNQYTNKSKDAA